VPARAARTETGGCFVASYGRQSSRDKVVARAKPGEQPDLHGDRYCATQH
jgi:hypothetical protein